MNENQFKTCCDCKYFCPPDDPKYHQIPEIAIGTNSYDFGQGYMQNSSCLIKDEHDNQLSIHAALHNETHCGPDRKFYTPKPIRSIVDSLLNLVDHLRIPKI